MSTRAVVEPELADEASEPDTPRDVHGRPHFFSPLSRRWAFALPVLQFFALFYYSTPTFDDVKSSLDLFGVVGALLLTMVLVLPSAAGGYEALKAADARFFDLVEGVDNSKYAAWWAKHPLGRGLAISDSFVRLSTLTVSLLSAEVLLVVVMYFNVIFGSVTTPHSGQVETKRMEFEWYRYARWVMLAIVSLLISGTVVFFIAFWVYVLITAPDQGLEEHGAMPWHPYLGAYGYVYIVQMVLLSSILIFMCLMGWAQKRIMELPQDPSPYELERKERYAAHVQGLAKARAAEFHARKKAKSKAGDDGGARSTTTASESSKSKEPTRRPPATQAAKVTSRSAKIPSTSGTRSE